MSNDPKYTKVDLRRLVDSHYRSIKEVQRLSKSKNTILELSRVGSQANGESKRGDET